MTSIIACLCIFLELSLLWPYAISMDFQNSAIQQTKRGSHVRVKRGWAWEPLYVTEEQEVAKALYVGQIKSDSDKEDGSIKYILSGDGAGTIFTMNENSGKISVLKKLDREQKSFYTLRAQAINRLTGVPVETESEFVIKILDINDNKPKFINEPYFAEVPEMSPKGTFVTQVTAIDMDDPAYGNNAKLVFSILQEQPQFSVEIKSGIIRVASQIDRETKDQYHVIIQVKDMIGNMGALSSTTTVTITVSDINDNAPKFQQKTYNMSIIESASTGEIVGVILADDIDVGRNAEVVYSIEERGDYTMFNISTDYITQEGIITLNKVVDFEKRIRRYNIQVRAQNTFQPELFDTAIIRIYVVDVDEPPVFVKKEYIMEVLENVTLGSHIGSVTAKDPDIANSSIRYGILQTNYWKPFDIYPNNGSIITTSLLDRESDPWHNITVTATETKNPAHIAYAEVHIRVIDVNDNAPQLQKKYDTYVCEKSRAGQFVETISAIDKDELSYSFSFTVPPDEASNENFTVTDNGDNTATILTAQDGYNYQETPLFYMTIIISDNGVPSLSSTNTLTINVCDCGFENNTKSCRQGGYFYNFLSSGTFIAISVFTFLILVLALLVHMKFQKKHAMLIEKGEDLKENIVQYDDEGGGEEDTEAFDMIGLRHHTVMREHKKKRTIRTDIQSMYRLSLGLGPDVAIFKEFLSEKLEEANTDPSIYPPDSLHSYAFEGTGSTSGSLSSIASSDLNADSYF